MLNFLSQPSKQIKTICLKKDKLLRQKFYLSQNKWSSRNIPILSMLLYFETSQKIPSHNTVLLLLLLTAATAYFRVKKSEEASTKLKRWIGVRYRQCCILNTTLHFPKIRRTCSTKNNWFNLLFYKIICYAHLQKSEKMREKMWKELLKSFPHFSHIFFDFCRWA